MQKFLSLVLAFLMVFSTLAMCIVPITATSETEGSGDSSYLPDNFPEGITAINNETDFANMEPDGTYYLANNISLSERYGIFKGILYGNGKAITINNDSQMVFTELDGAKVYDLTVQGSSTSNTGSDVGALAQTSNNVYLYRVMNDATVKAEANAAGLVAIANGTTTLEGCVNMGAITVTTGSDNAGGLIALNKGSVFAKNCNNYGNVTASSSSSVVGGIVGRHQSDDTDCTLTFENCRISATLSATGSSGGVVGYFKTACNKIDVENCTFDGSLTTSSNSGGIIGKIEKVQSLNIVSTTVSASITGNGDGVGGILGYLTNVPNEAGSANIESCVVTGSITNGNGRVGGILGYVSTIANNSTFQIANCAVLSPEVKNTSSDSSNYVGGIAGYINPGSNTSLKKLAINSNVVISNIVATDAAGAGGIIGRKGDHKTKLVVSDNLFIGSVSACKNIAGGIAYDAYIGSGKLIAYERNAIYADISSENAQAVAFSGSGNLLTDTTIESNVFVGTLTADKTVLIYQRKTFTAESAVPPTSKNYWLRTEESYNKDSFYAWGGFNNGNYASISEYDSKYALTSNDKSDEVLTDLGEDWTYVTDAALPCSTDTFTGYIPASAKTTLETVAEALANEGEVKVIKTADDFYNMDPSGSYKLADGVEIVLSYSVTLPFSGTLDGNSASGASVTIQGSPVFRNFSNGTIKNLTVNGSVTDNNAAYLGAIANQATNVSLENVTVNATVTAANGCAGGFFGAVHGDSSFVNCSNKSNVTAYSFAGGITAFVSDTANFDHCSNSGDVKATYTRVAGDSLLIKGFAGGITAYAGANINESGVITSVSDPSVTVTSDGTRKNVSSPLKQHVFKYCSNSGAVYGVHYVGGILGTTFDSARFEYCSNNAVVTGDMSVRLYTGGIVGMVFVEGYFYRCDNAGEVYGNAMTGGIAGAVGIIGSVLGPENGQYFIGCTHTGKVVVNYNISVSNDDKRTSGGIVGYARSDAAYKSIVISYCGVTGTIEFNSVEGNQAINASVLCGSADNLTYAVFEYNYFTGSIKITGKGFATYLPYATGSFVSDANKTANYSVYAENLVYTCDNSGKSELPEDYIINTKLPGGAIDYKWLCEVLNKSFDEDVFVLDTNINNGVNEIGIPVPKKEEPKEEATLTEIKTAEDFLKMNPYGNYVLLYDITINTTYPYVFCGKFDGNGNTITTTVPVFNQIEGAIISNLTINGSINTSAASVGALANTAVTVTLDTVTNKADVTNTLLLVNKDDHTRATGGLIGRAVGTIVLTNCRNDGDIAACMPAGIVGVASKNIVFAAKNCINSGAITNLTYRASAGGGILACGFDGSYSLENCINTGDILFGTATAHTAYAGGIIGTIWTSTTISDFTMTDCVNNGLIMSNFASGGVVGYILYGTINATFEGCKNAGKVISTKDVAGGIVGRISKADSSYYTSDFTQTFNNCINVGDVIAHNSAAGGILGFSGANVNANYCINTGKVSIDNHYSTGIDFFRAGGIVGYVIAKAKIQYCVNTGNVEGYDQIAGILGYSGSASYATSGFVVRYCVNTGNIYASREGSASGIVGYLYGGSPAVTNNTVAGSVKSDGGVANGIIRQCNGGGADYRNNVILLGKNDVAGSATYLIGAKIANSYDANTEKVGSIYVKKDVFDYFFSRTVNDSPAPVTIPEDHFFENVSDLAGKPTADFVVEGGIPMHKDVVAVYRLLDITADDFIPEGALPVIPEDTEPDVTDPIEPDTSVTEPEDTNPIEPDTSVTEPEDTKPSDPSDETTKPSDDTTAEPDDDTTTGSTDSGKKKGCGSVVSGAIAIAALALITPAVVVLKKRDEE